MLNKQKNKEALTITLRENASQQHLDFYQTFTVHSDSVSEALRDEIPLWSPLNPVLIDGRTGIGKTTFVYDELLADAASKRKNLLIISNRIALSAQQKLENIKRLGSPLGHYLTEEGLLHQEDFGRVRIITYHRLPAFLSDRQNKKWCESLLYVIADECHFFVADSPYNDLCDYYLKLITERFTNTIRIYLTATSWDVLAPLAKAEHENYMSFLPSVYWTPGRAFVHYFFPAKYDNYRLHFFENLRDLIPQIKAEPQSKWLIFVDSKEQGEILQEALSPNADFIHKDSKDTRAWKDIVYLNRYEKQVLITTAVLDSGVNILDDDVHHVVILSDDHTSFMQMLGRKRCKPGEQVDLWVQELSTKKIAKRRAECKELLSVLDRYDDPQTALESNQYLAHEIWRKGNPKLYPLFNLSKGRLYRNELAYYYLKRRSEYLDSLTPNSFRECVYSWLGIAPKAAVALTDLEKFYAENGNTALSEEQESYLRKTIVRIFTGSGFVEPQPTRVDTLGVKALNNRLEKLQLGYRIDTRDGKWTLIRNEEGSHEI